MVVVIAFLKGRLPFQVPEKVPWPALAQALTTKFASNCGLGISPENLNYLAFKIFGPADDYSMHFVTWTQFNRVSVVNLVLHKTRKRLARLGPIPYLDWDRLWDSWKPFEYE